MEVRGQLATVSSLPPPYGSRGLTSVHRIWWQVALFIDPPQAWDSSFQMAISDESSNTRLADMTTMSPCSYISLTQLTIVCFPSSQVSFSAINLLFSFVLLSLPIMEGSIFAHFPFLRLYSIFWQKCLLLGLRELIFKWLCGCCLSLKYIPRPFKVDYFLAVPSFLSLLSFFSGSKFIPHF